MKVIIFSSTATKIYLHINKIHRVHTHRFSHYTKTTVHLNNYKIFISDFQHGDFNQVIHDFIKSDEKLKILPIKDVIHDEPHEILFTLVDWVSEAMGDR
jgi:hypothetical protein